MGNPLSRMDSQHAHYQQTSGPRSYHSQWRGHDPYGDQMRGGHYNGPGEGYQYQQNNGYPSHDGGFGPYRSQPGGVRPNGTGCGSIDSNDFEDIQGSPTNPYGRRGQGAPPRKFKEEEEHDPFANINFDDEELRKQEFKHQQNLKALDEDYERRMRALETVRKRKMEETFAEYSKHPNFPKNKPAYAESYNMGEFKHRGLCLIVKNSDRFDKSAELLKDIFIRFGYQVNVEKNLTEEKMLTTLQYWSIQNFEKYGSFVSFFLCKGTDKYMETVDKKAIDFRTVVDFFKPTYVPSLAGKPKLFFFQSDIDILDPKLLWKENKKDKAPIVDYMDAFVVRSTHRDLLKNFTNILKQDNKMPLSALLDNVARHTMPLASDKEKYETVSTLRKEVYFGQNESVL